MQNLSTTKVGEHIPTKYLMSKKCKFDSKENEHDVFRSEDCMKKFCQSLREHAMKAIIFENKKMTPLANKKQEVHEKIKISFICKKMFVCKYNNDEIYR